MRVLAFDIGEKRVGIAYGDTDHNVAMPVAVLPAAAVESHAAPFRRLLEDYEPDLLVAGRPLTLKGEPGPQAQRVEAVARSIAARCGLELCFADERLSSAQAKRIMHEQGMSEKQMRGKLDSVAASLFLQTWLDRRAHQMMGDS